MSTLAEVFSVTEDESSKASERGPVVMWGLAAEGFLVTNVGWTRIRGEYIPSGDLESRGYFGIACKDGWRRSILVQCWIEGLWRIEMRLTKPTPRQSLWINRVLSFVF